MDRLRTMGWGWKKDLVSILTMQLCLILLADDVVFAAATSEKSKKVYKYFGSFVP